MEVDTAFDANIAVIEHVPEQGGIAVGRHGLKRIAEVAIVATGTHWDPRGDAGVEPRGLHAPMLARVALEERLEELAPDRVHHHIFAGLHRFAPLAL